MKYIDTHAHYNEVVYDGQLDQVLEQCREANVTKIINIGYNEKSSLKSIQLSENYDYIYATIGVHPHDVEHNSAEDIFKIYENNRDKKIVAIGEIGLDYAFVKDNKEKQIALFTEQIELANALKLPIVIHSRDASLDTYRVIKDMKQAQYGTLFHCFHPTDDLVRLVLENGYMVAFGGNITYKRNLKFYEYIKNIPIKQIVIETDSPYLPPEPYRGKTNISAYLPIIAKKLAECKQMDLEELTHNLYHNSIQFFNLDK